MAIQGHCNCGTVTIEVAATPDTIALCSCTSCRASSGSLFSVNLVVPAEQLTITSGEGNVTEYDDKNTDSGHTATRRFCRTCGSAISTVVKENPGTHYVKGGLFPPGTLPPAKLEIFKRNWESWQKPQTEQQLEGGL
ncbi:hypothetical protein JCM10213_007812 [Rhodosporidiobolus nylandii]